MGKISKIAIVIGVILILIILSVIIFISLKPKTDLEPINSAEDLVKLVDNIYEGQNIDLELKTQIVDITDVELVKSMTGLENAEEVDYVVVSESELTEQAYSLVLVKIKKNIDAEEIAATMNNCINARKWDSSTAKKIYTTSSADVVCLVMSSEELAKPVYEKFKVLAGKIGEEYEKTEIEILEPDMY